MAAGNSNSRFWLGLVFGVVAVGAIGLGAFYLGRVYQTPAGPSLEQQRQCADAANTAFQAGGNPGGTFAGHYNGGYGRCFVEINSRDDVHAFTSISDAVEHTEYALYVVSFTGGNTTLVECRVRLPNLPFVPCRSLAEWQNLAKPLMGQ